jgi:nitrite reductase/ring-hydroxylating ferredoxin subunit
MAHALLNGVGAVLYLASFGLRKAGRRKTGIALGMLGYGFAGAAAYLGGELSYGLQLGVKHTAIPVEPEPGYTAVLPEADLPEDTLTRVDYKGIPVLLRRRGRTIDAVGAVCTHRGAALDEGALEGDCVRCPWHGSLFRLTDGTIAEGPASFPLPRFTARITAGAIEISATP